MRFLGKYLVILLVVHALLIVINLSVDPYGIFRIVDKQGFNARKLYRANVEQTYKPAELARLSPCAVVIGSSTAQFGINPRSVEAVTDCPAYNFSIDGPTMYEIRWFSHYALENADLSHLILVLDFMMFDGGRALHNARFNKWRMTSSRGLGRTCYFSAGELYRYVASMKAARHSLQTVRNQEAGRPYYDDLGFIPRQNVDLRPDRLGMAFDSSRRAYLGLFSEVDDREFWMREDGQSMLDYLDDVIAECASHEVRLTIVLSPVNDYFEGALRDVGLEPALESWRVAVRELTTGRDGGKMVRFFDYTRDERNAEQPLKGHRMRYWNDSYHFSHYYGDEIVKEILHGGVE